MVPSPVSSLSLLLLEDEDELSLGSLAWAALPPRGGFFGAPPSFSFCFHDQLLVLAYLGVAEVVLVHHQLDRVAAEAAVEAAAEAA